MNRESVTATLSVVASLALGGTSCGKFLGGRAALKDPLPVVYESPENRTLCRNTFRSVHPVQSLRGYSGAKYSKLRLVTAYAYVELRPDAQTVDASTTAQIDFVPAAPQSKVICRDFTALSKERSIGVMAKWIRVPLEIDLSRHGITQHGTLGVPIPTRYESGNEPPSFDLHDTSVNPWPLDKFAWKTGIELRARAELKHLAVGDEIELLTSNIEDYTDWGESRPYNSLRFLFGRYEIVE